MTFDLPGLAPFVEPVAVLTAIGAVALTVRQHIANWPIGIVSVCLFLYLFLQAGLYADSILQVLYIGLGFYGWWHWLHGGPPGDDLPVTSASPRLRVALAIGAVLATLAFGAFLDASTDSTVPYPDAATTVLSVTAQLLLTRKHIESWPVWIFGVNIPFIAIYLYKGLAMTALLQVVFIALSVAGWAAWRRSMAEASGGPAMLVTQPVPVAVLE
jgi:nicotinamide mononucleotide transporter